MKITITDYILYFKTPCSLLGMASPEFSTWYNDGLNQRSHNHRNKNRAGLMPGLVEGGVMWLFSLFGSCFVVSQIAEVGSKSEARHPHSLMLLPFS